jgi:2-polyprenyl-6-hydroxyphenyl methylase/3-demethylubiquinone-9 3-methyltransferase
MAETVLGWVPEGTHEWAKYVTPGELRSGLEKHGMRIKETRGMGYNPATGDWSLLPEFLGSGGVNYIMAAEKI